MFASGKTKTELVWSNKKKDLGIIPKLPFQTAEIVNETKKKTLASFSPIEDKWYNLLIWGDNKLVMNSLLDFFEGKINLIYIDPPFAKGADFRIPITIEEEKFIKEPSGIEIKAYRDTWGKGLASYLQMMYERLVLMRKLLADNGSIYVHLDAHVGHYIKAIMDEIFGKDCFQREIIWRIGWISGYKAAAKNWIRNHDTILYYVKNSNNFLFNKEYVPYPPGYTRRGGEETTGKGYAIEDVWNANPFEFELKGDESLDSIQIKSFSTEKTGFATQKNESLVRRIIKASSNEGDLVADFFSGSGTTLAVAEKLGRKWIGCDLSKYAIEVTRKRLLDIPGCKPFKTLNLGMYQKRKLMENGIKSYGDFITKIYNAEPISGYSHLHSRKGRRLVHIGTPDSFVTEREVRRALEECKSAGSIGLDILGWEFEMGLHELIDDIAREYGIDVKLKQIPIDILNMRKRELKEVKFFDLNYLDLDLKVEGKKATVEIKRFSIANQEYLPDKIKSSINNFSSYIDYWAVDFDYKGVFHNMRQEYRTRENKKLKTKISYEYDNPGSYDILVKVIDIFGNDTSRILNARIE